MNVTPISVAEKIIKNTEHQMGNAVLYGVTEDGSNFELGRAPDIYDLLEGEYPSKGIVGLAIHTTGWAAPLNENGELDGTPSEHEDRRRVSLITTVTHEGSGSALAFADEADAIVGDPGSATGTLAEAIVDCWVRSGGSTK